ncbi:uncharacterized protein LOC133532892 [Cydia pomonella]|uniref:uncharacterized protein LOC133532892 n=1 Tax=Cydia pomonella TaxID=82600 RepID=UPI002ADE1A6B|nr:uncharacterized protein LOC133532892 [Cydia pomonella]
MADVKIKVTFVIPKHCSNENDCSEDMLIAYTACENHRGGGLQAQWAHENSLTFDQPPMKNDIFVLSEFEGELYETLKATKCLVVGPRCLSCSLTEGSPIPAKGHPVYTVAMRGLIVTLSGLSKESKINIKQKIEWMGGIYSAVLSSETTHLIANNVFSDKYIKAAERGIPVMKESWVTAVWDASLKLDINGGSSEFNAHRLPPFANLQITTSGLNSHDKKLIMKLVNANGGDFSRVFLSQTTDVLVLTKDSTSSEKYKAAIEFGKVCVNPHWVKDSAALGFALPVSRYKVTSTITSSPVGNRPVPDMSLNLTRITKEGQPNNFVDESKMAESMMLSGTSKLQESKRDSNVDEIQKAFEAFDVAAIKKAGPIFDGFCIWVSGLDGMPRERAWACVSKAGGTRYDGPNSRVTHAVSWGAAAAAAAAALPAVPLLSPLWLVRSVEAGRVLDEAEFLINTEPATPRKASQPPIAAASPMSKRTLQLLLPPPEPIVEEQPQRDHIVDHYLSQHLSQQQAAEASTSPEPVKKETSRNDDDTAVEFTQSENIFKDLIFEVQGLEDEAICEIGAEIRAEGGMLAAAGAGGTHVLVPLDFDHSQLVTKSAEAVTVFWVKDCLSQQALTPIEYYHRPVHLKSPASNPLHGVVACLSTYSGVERAFLDELAKLCGAVMQQRFCRRSNSSALASTHLICPEPGGAKYCAARKWGVPVVRAGWLLACARSGERPGEAEHAVLPEAAAASGRARRSMPCCPRLQVTSTARQGAGLPVVRAGWLLACARSGERPGEAEHAVLPEAAAASGRARRSMPCCPRLQVTSTARQGAGLPVVRAGWLLACARSGERPGEAEHAVLPEAAAASGRARRSMPCCPRLQVTSTARQGAELPVVRAGWLLACARSGERPGEAEHAVLPEAAAASGRARRSMPCCPRLQVTSTARQGAGLPVVRAGWLLACARSGERPGEAEHAVLPEAAAASGRARRSMPCCPRLQVTSTARQGAGLPVVRAGWLLACARSGERPGEAEHAVLPEAAAASGRARRSMPCCPRLQVTSTARQGAGLPVVRAGWLLACARSGERPGEAEHAVLPEAAAASGRARRSMPCCPRLQVTSTARQGAGLPVVRAGWLLACARSGERPGEAEHAVLPEAAAASGRARRSMPCCPRLQVTSTARQGAGLPVVRAGWLLACARSGERPGEAEHAVLPEAAAASGRARRSMPCCPRLQVTSTARQGAGLPVVRAGWLLACARSGERPGEAEHAVLPEAAAASGRARRSMPCCPRLQVTSTARQGAGLPVVRAGWLLACARSGERPGEAEHAVLPEAAVLPARGRGSPWSAPAGCWPARAAASGRARRSMPCCPRLQVTSTARQGAGLPVVRAGWLLACARSGERPGEAEHAVLPEAADSSHVQQNTLVNAAETPEPKRSIPQPEEKPEPQTETPEPEKRPKPKSKTPEPELKSKTPEPQDLDANVGPEFEQIPPEVGTAVSPLQTKKKFTVNTNKNEQFEGMSPASRFIAMRRMGMFSDHDDSSKENTPKRPGNESDSEILSSPNLKGFSPNTRKNLQAIRRGEIPDGPIKTPNNPFDNRIPTPDSAFGAALRPGRPRMSVDARKLLWEFVDGLPTNESRTEMETPPSKMAKFTEDQCAGGARIPDIQTTPLAPKPVQDSRPSVVPLEVDEQLQRLNVVLTGRRTPRRVSRVQPLPEKPADMEYESGPESQPNTVGWDDTTPSQKESFESSKPHTTVTTLDKSDKTKSNIEPKENNASSEINVEKDSSKMVVNVSNSVLKVDKAVEAKREEKRTVKNFMLSSNVDNREETVEMILRLGGLVTDLDDDEAGRAAPATHLLCAAPARSQRVLNCIAGGCWVLHPAYVARSAAHGTFLPEENFEWGNPVASCLPPVSGGERVLALAAHRWRTRRARGQPGPFAGVVALLHAPEQRRKLLARLVKAGEGTVVDEEPPYTDETINVCFADPKRYPMKERDRAWLVSRRVPVCASILLSAFLTEENRPDLNQHCLSEFRQ